MESAQQTPDDERVIKDDESYYAVDDSYEALKAFIMNYRKENGRTYHRLSDGTDSYPEATVLGVDLSPIQPGIVPPNCYFEADDVEQEWQYEEPFDFIFMRAMVGSFRDWPSILAKAYDNLEPGGYVEIQDNEFPVRCDDNTMPEDSVILKWTEYMVEATEEIGQPIDVAPSFKRLVEEAGFVDVKERIAYWPVGTWPRDPFLKEIGRYSVWGRKPK
ncbi:methyltransferase domain-containing protein [Colletotrichum sp. SAR 10_98]|nr:methyltransferase domain-containing protein [Colletotrichum sp. SAR 10_98]